MMRTITWALGACLAVALVSSSGLARPKVGDAIHGGKVFKRSSKRPVKVDGAWINAISDSGAVKYTKAGKRGFPRVTSDNVLDHYDVVAYVRSRNSDMRDLMDGGSHVLVASGTMDKYAIERLKERAEVEVSKSQKQGRVFVFYDLGKRSDGQVTLVSPKNSKKRDKLKPNKKLGYVVFQKLEGLRDGKYEAAFAVNKDIEITAVEIRAPDGTVPDDLNRAAQRLVGKGGRGKYDLVKLVGAGKAVRELEKPLSHAFLVGMETVYMYEVKERDYFAFDVE